MVESTGVTEEDIRREIAFVKQKLDAKTLASAPGGLKKRHPRPAYDDDATYRPGAFAGLFQENTQ
jgi:hypothetical protein